MNPSRLAEQLRREARAHPKKAAVLGLLALVALWFWVPLVWGWLAAAEEAAATPVPRRVSPVVPAAPGAVAAQPDATPGRGERPNYPWHQLVRWMDNDPRTSAVDPALGRRDPFRAAGVQPSKADSQDQPQEVSPALTAENLSMVLSSTIVGLDRRVAQIDGKSYRQGEVVRLVRNGQPIQLTVAEVYPRRVVLECQGRQFELAIPDPACSGRIELSGGTRTRKPQRGSRKTDAARNAGES